MDVNEPKSVDVQVAGEKIIERKRRGFWADLFIRLLKEKPLGTLGLVITLLILLTGIFANLIAPYGVNEVHTSDTLQAPSSRFIMGTDDLGRDVFSRIVYGARFSMIIGISAPLIGALIANTIGMLCGYLGGKFDIVVQRFVDAWMCFPNLVLLILMRSVVGPGMVPLILILSSGGIAASRYSRSIILKARQEIYFDAANAAGGSTWWIITKHALPAMIPYILLGFSLDVPGTILAESSLSFLGLGVPPPAPSWGGMLSGSSYWLNKAPWIAVWPGVALSLTVFGINMFGDAIRDLIDPRLKGGLGRYSGVVKRLLKLKRGQQSSRNE